MIDDLSLMKKSLAEKKKKLFQKIYFFNGSLKSLPLFNPPLSYPFTAMEIYGTKSLRKIQNKKEKNFK